MQHLCLPALAGVVSVVGCCWWFWDIAACPTLPLLPRPLPPTLPAALPGLDACPYARFPSLRAFTRGLRTRLAGRLCLTSPTTPPSPFFPDLIPPCLPASHPNAPCVVLAAGLLLAIVVIPRLVLLPFPAPCPLITTATHCYLTHAPLARRARYLALPPHACPRFVPGAGWCPCRLLRFIRFLT